MVFLNQGLPELASFQGSFNVGSIPGTGRQRQLDGCDAVCLRFVPAHGKRAPIKKGKSD